MKKIEEESLKSIADSPAAEPGLLFPLFFSSPLQNRLPKVFPKICTYGFGSKKKKPGLHKLPKFDLAGFKPYGDLCVPKALFVPR